MSIPSKAHLGMQNKRVFTIIIVFFAISFEINFTSYIHLQYQHANQARWKETNRWGGVNLKNQWEVALVCLFFFCWPNWNQSQLLNFIQNHLQEIEMTQKLLTDHFLQLSNNKIKLSLFSSGPQKPRFFSLGDKIRNDPLLNLGDKSG